MAITIKSGVPGSGKTQSMVADLFAYLATMKKTGIHRPIYTNITGLDQAVIPHFPMAEMPPGHLPFVREPGVMYTIDWQDCPPESIIIIDEAQKNGFDATSSQKAVPLHISQLAVHRKDYSVDIWLITQHPKLLHNAARRQCGKHQHYERKFGFKSAFCHEWHECQDNLTGKKTAVLSRFAFDNKFQKAYHSADVHTKTKFKIPLWAWIPVIAIPLGIAVLPRAYGALSGAMTGKGVGQNHETQTKTVVENGVVVTKTVSTFPAVPASGPVPSLPSAPAPAVNLPPVQVVSGCIATPKRCACFDDKGGAVELPQGSCESRILGMSSPGQKADISRFKEPEKPVQRYAEALNDGEIFAYMAKASRSSH